MPFMCNCFGVGRWMDHGCRNITIEVIGYEIEIMSPRLSHNILQMINMCAESVNLQAYTFRHQAYCMRHDYIGFRCRIVCGKVHRSTPSCMYMYETNNTNLLKRLAKACNNYENHECYLVIYNAYSNPLLPFARKAQKCTYTPRRCRLLQASRLLQNIIL